MTVFRSAILAMSLALAHPAFAADAISVTDAYARFLPGAKAGAAFMVIENHRTEDDRLLAAKSDVSDLAELHTHKMSADGMAQMLPIEGGIAIAAGGHHELARGADHLMFMGLKGKIGDGQVITLTLTFEKAGDVVVEVPVDNQR